VVEGEPVERHRHERCVADHVAEARARDARSALHVEAGELRVLARLGERRGFADAPELFGVVLAVAVGRGRVWRVRHQSEGRIAIGFNGSQLVLGLLQRGLDRAERLELLRSRLALQLLSPAELVDLRHQLAPALVRHEQFVERLGGSGALARDGRSEGLGFGPRGSEVDQPFVR
jgi:hypothetical protein